MRSARPGIFGKLPARGDFVTRDLSPRLLHVWEGWLQDMLAAAHDRFGQNFAAVWRGMPVWRFWIGPDVAGIACAGAIVASHDRVGRQFPLAFILPEADEGFPPPPVVDPFEAWYGRLEARLTETLALTEIADLSILAEGLGPDEAAMPHAASDIDAAEPAEAGPAGIPDDGEEAENLPAAVEGDGSSEADAAREPAPSPPETPPLWPPLPRQHEDPRRALWALAGGSDAVALLADAAAADHYRAAAGRSYWWTTGGTAGQAAMIALAGLPDAGAFELLLRGGRA